MSYLLMVLAALFGVSWGVSLCWVDTRTSAWLPKLCHAITLAAVIVLVIISGPAGSIPGLVLAAGTILGFILAAGVLWAGHPALDGQGYGERVRSMLLNGSEIRLHREELPANHGDSVPAFATPDSDARSSGEQV